MVRKKNKMFVDSADRTPHYSLRKLSVGVASVLLSTTLWMGANGSVAHADTINDATVAGKVEDKLDPSETHKDQTQAQAAESTSQASVASAEKQNGEAQKGQAQVAVANANQAVKKQAQEVDSANAEAQTATANDAQADVEKQEPAAQSQQTAPQAQVSAPASVKEQASTAEGQTNDSANADAAIDATTEEKKDSANPEANSSDAATEGAKNESTTLDVSQAFKTSTAATVTKKMVMSSLADSISENKTKLAKANADTTTVPGFSVTDPEYPSEMYRDPNSEHYTFFWVGQTDNGYQTVISTNRNGNGQIHVFELNQNNIVLNSFDLDKNQSRTSKRTGVTYFNDEYAGLVRGGLQTGLTLKYEVSGGKSDQIYDGISFIVPRLNTQVTSYQDEDGNDIIDNNGEKVEPVVQKGLDGQKYTTTDTKVIDGYYAIAPSNAQGTMSPYGKIGSTYEKNYHDGYISEYTQINNDGDMYVQMYREDERGRRIAVTQAVIIKPGDIYTYSRVGKTYYLRSIYIPQTIDIKYVYKKLGNTVLVDEDGNPLKTPTQYPNDPNDPTKAGKVVIPQYEGYTPKINGVPVGPDGFIPAHPGEDTKVVYTANAQTATITYIDDTDNKKLGSDNQNGKFNQVITFEHDPAEVIKGLEEKGYVFVSNTFENQKYQADNKSNSFEVHLKHGTKNVSRDHNVNMTVHYVMDDGSDAPSDNKQTLSFTENGIQDLVTKDITWTPADSQTFKDVVTPKLTGYTPDQDKAAGQTVNFGDTDINVTVHYNADAQTATITYIDDKTGKTLKVDNLNGVTNAKSGYTTKAAIDTYTGLGYTLVSDDTNGTEVVFDNDDAADQAYTVHLSHGTITVTPENPGKPGEPINPGEGSANYPEGTDKAGLTDTVNRTITYVMSDGAKAPDAVHDSLSYTASKVIDKVTGEVLETKWSANQDFKDVDSPSVKGYTPDKTVVSNKNVAHDAKDIDVVVTYTANSAAALVQFIDNTENRTLDNLELSGKTGETIDFAKANAQLKSYLDHGYKLVANGIPTTETKFDTSDDTDGPSQVFVVRLDHTMTPGETTVSGKQTVTYVYKDKDGKVVKTKTVEEGTTFTGKTTKDEVTGKTTTTWDQKDHKYTEVTTPVEPGYTADKKSVGGDTVTPDDPNRSYTVVYTPNGSIVPVDPNGNPIPGTHPVPYETDPTDPTKVVDGKVPEVPGWTPKNGAPVKPSDPTKDTEVPYDHTMTPGETTATGKVEGLPEKPAKSAKAPAEKLVETPVKAPKAVKTAEPAKTISIKESAQAQDQLPQTGEDNSKAAFGLGLASILGGIGILGAFKRKKKEN